MIVPESFLIDSNILVYAYDSSDKVKQQQALAFLRSIAQVKPIVSIQNLVEFHATVTEKIEHRISIEESKSRVMKMAGVFSVLIYTPSTLLLAADIQHAHKIHFFDALLVATMKEFGIHTIYTENTKDFTKIPWLNVVNPLR